MTFLALETPNGIAPRIHPKKLADTMAVKSENTRLDRGVLEPWRGIEHIAAGPSEIRSLYRYQGNFLTSSFRRMYVGSLRPNDVHQRIYYTDHNYPKVRSGNAEYRLGLPRPAAPALEVVKEGDLDNITDVTNTRYRVTIVDAFKTEGPPSDPTHGIEIGKGFKTRLDLTPCRVTGNYNLGAGAMFRIYRSNTGSVDAIYQFVDEVPYSAESYEDEIPSADLQEALPSLFWHAAPDDDRTLYPDGPLQSLIEVPGAILAGHSGNTVFLSEPGVPTAWPYSYSVGAKIVGLVMVQGGIFIATEESPYLLTGSEPAAMVVVPIESERPQSCVSAASIVDMGGFAIYASPDGLVVAQGNTASLVTAEFIDKDAWAEFQPETIRAWTYEGKYLAAYGNPSEGKGFVFDPEGGRNVFVTLADFPATAGWYSHLEDELYVGYSGGIGRFNTGEPRSYDRVTKIFSFADPVSLSIVRVEADSYPVEFEIFADKVSRGVFTFQNNDPVRLPGGYRAREYQFAIRGSGTVTGIYLADNMQEMV